MKIFCLKYRPTDTGSVGNATFFTLLTVNNVYLMSAAIMIQPEIVRSDIGVINIVE